MAALSGGLPIVLLFVLLRPAFGAAPAAAMCVATWRTAHDLVIGPGESASGRVRIGIEPACPDVEECLELRDVTVRPRR